VFIEDGLVFAEIDGFGAVINIIALSHWSHFRSSFWYIIMKRRIKE